MSENISDISKPITFGQLEVLIDWLMEETDNAQEDILRKTEALNETQAKIGKNENQLIEMDDAVKGLAVMIGKVENDLEHMDYDFESMEKAINQLESAEGPQCCNCLPRPKTERKQLLETLLEAEANMRQLHTIAAEMEDTRKCALLKPSPFLEIFKILNCHMETLHNTQKNMDLIADKMLEISTKWPKEATSTTAGDV